jgi:hypothetical protein
MEQDATGAIDPANGNQPLSTNSIEIAKSRFMLA